MTDLRFKNLGNTKIKIPSIGLGTGTGFKYKNKKREQELIHILQKAADLGMNFISEGKNLFISEGKNLFIDTAESYFDGYAEKLIGKAFKRNRKKILISTKFSPENCSYAMVIKSCEASLKRLQTDYIDLYQIHWPNPIIPIEETLKALEKLVEVGKVKHIGVCNFSLRQLKDVQKISRLPIVSLQTEYNLLERTVENELLPFCERNNITLIAYTPLNSGNILKTEKYLKFFSDLSKKYKRSASQIILNFLISQPAVIAIPATTSTVHLKENAESAEFELEKKDLQTIAKVFTTKITSIDTRKIKVATLGDHAVYRTFEEALANKLNFFPSPRMLSVDIQKGDFLKPVKIRKMVKKKGVFEYELLGGRIRYWAWVIAHRGKKPIPAIVED